MLSTIYIIAMISFLNVASYAFQNNGIRPKVNPSLVSDKLYQQNVSPKNSKIHPAPIIQPLAMSSNDDEIATTDSFGFYNKKKESNWRDALPPLPEDHLILTGDIFSLFTYCFMDHITDDLFSEDSILHALVTSTPQSIKVPVWSDASLHNFGSSLLREIMNQQQIAHIGSSSLLSLDNMPIPHHVPLFHQPGVAFVFFTSAWILSGYFNRSFSLSNTIQCDPRQALNIVFKTWIFTAAIMFGIAWISGQICGCDILGTVGFSKSDVEFIFDSLTVLAVWRFVVASMLNPR